MVKPRSKREALSRERILRAAVAILDREGLEAISMRRVGVELGVEAMSLYNHVANKAAILDGIFETILEEVPTARRTDSWAAALRELAGSLRAVLAGHPNALPIFATRPAVTPASIARVEEVLEVLRCAGFSARDALCALQVLVAFVLGHTVASYPPHRPEEASAPAYDQLSAAQFPRVHEMTGLLADHDVEQEFEFGLAAMLEGLAARLASAPRAAPASTPPRAR